MNGSKATLRYSLRALGLVVVVLFCASCGNNAADVEKLISDAKQQRDKGNHSAAIIQLKNALQKSPHNAEARYLLGAAYNDTGEFSSAETHLARALELRHEPAKTVPALGKSLLMQGKFQKLLDEIQLDADFQKPVQAEILTLRARASIGLGRKKEHRELLEQALLAAPDSSEVLMEQARVATSEKKFDDAARLVERALANDPNNADAWIAKGDLHRISRTKEAAEAAEAAYQKAISINPNNVLARLNVAALLIDAGKLDAAAQQIALARKIAPTNAMAVYLQAQIEFRKNDKAAARETLQRLLKAAPDHVPGLLLAGAVEVALGSHAQAQIYLERVLARVPNSLIARKLLISSFAKSGKVQSAIEVLQPALKQAPDDPAVLALAGEIYMQNNEFSKAGEFFDRVAKLDPKSARARTRLGLSRLASGETDRALADLESAVQLESTEYQADVLLVMSYVRRANYEQALQAIKTLEKKQPKNPLTYNLKAAIYLGKKDAANARKNLEQALALQPTYVPAAMNLAQLDLKDKDPKAARARFETILAKDKDNSQALLALAALGPRIGADQKERIGWLERAAKASPASIQPPLQLARLYVQAGDVKKALEAAQRAQVINPDNPDALDALGSLQVASGHKAEAMTTYNKLAALQPNSPVALYRLAGAQAVNGDKAAAGTLRKALAIKPDFAEAQVALVNLETEAGRYAEAMKIAQQIQKQQPKSGFGFALEGDIWMAQKKFAQAATAYETAYGMRKSGMLAMKLHAVYTAAGKTDAADARLTQWLKESPDDAAVRTYVADVALRRSKYQEAMVQYEWLVAKNADNVVALNNLAWIYQQVKDPRALETAERAYKLKPDNAAIADTLGWMLVEHGKVARGVEILEKAVTAAPHAPEIRFHLAQAWMKKGDKAKARAELERLLSGGTAFAQETAARELLKQLTN